jgi:hypothetical protein
LPSYCRGDRYLDHFGAAGVCRIASSLPQLANAIAESKPVTARVSGLFILARGTVGNI